MRWFLGILFAAVLRAAVPAPDLAPAFRDLYNFDFTAAHAAIDAQIAAHPQAPLPYSVRAAAYLFFELDRLRILESEFFEDDKRIIEKKKLKPDPGVRARFLQAVADAQQRAGAVLAKNPNDIDALFAMCVTTGVSSDYMALVEKRQIGSLSTVRQSNGYALRLLKIDPKFYDAYLTTGISEYLLGSLPFFIRWFVHFDGIQGSKDQAKRNLELVAREGRYLGPFARILLGIIYLREKRPSDARQLLVGLTREYPENPLLRKELAKVSAQTGVSAR